MSQNTINTCEGWSLENLSPLGLRSQTIPIVAGQISGQYISWQSKAGNQATRDIYEKYFENQSQEKTIDNC